MGKITGFLEYERQSNLDIPVRERVRNFKEFHRPLGEEERRKQGARCMNCGVPFCQSAMRLAGMVTGCPLHNLIPEWNDQIYQGHDEHAYHRLNKTSNFPEFTGRVCPALCEKACINGEYGDPVTIHDNELFLIEKAFAQGTVRPQIPAVRSGKRVAVVGSGPSGLAVADTLNHRGHSVTVYERADRIGGLLMYGIPNMKLEKSVILRRQKLMEEEGVTFVVSTHVGVDLSFQELLDDYDAVVMCCGAKKPRSLDGIFPGEQKGVYAAVDFLTATTRTLLDNDIADEPAEKLSGMPGVISAEGKHVVIIGGGDTGNDCIGTSIRHGCASVTALEMMPKPPVERRESNPWPQWPLTLKTDYGHEEAIELFGADPRQYETTVKELHFDEDGQLYELVTSKVTFQDRKPVLVEGSEQVLPCELLLIAAGFVGIEDATAQASGVKLDARNTIDTPEGGYATSVEKIFAAGDVRRGQSLVVWAIAEGRACAKEVDAYLMGYTNL